MTVPELDRALPHPVSRFPGARTVIEGAALVDSPRGEEAEGRGIDSIDRIPECQQVVSGYRVDAAPVDFDPDPVG